MTRRSKYYAADESWTSSPAWAFEIPLGRLEHSRTDTVVLRYERGYRLGGFAELHVPCRYLLEHLGGLHVRLDRRNISLFLSAKGSDRFTDLRGSGRVRFSEFEKQRQ